MAARTGARTGLSPPAPASDSGAYIHSATEGTLQATSLPSYNSKPNCYSLLNTIILHVVYDQFVSLEKQFSSRFLLKIAVGVIIHVWILTIPHQRQKFKDLESAECCRLTSFYAIGSLSPAIRDRPDITPEPCTQSRRRRPDAGENDALPGRSAPALPHCRRRHYWNSRQSRFCAAKSAEIAFVSAEIGSRIVWWRGTRDRHGESNVAPRLPRLDTTEHCVIYHTYRAARSLPMNTSP